MATQLHAQAKGFLTYLAKNPTLRNRIRAPRDKTLLYAGHLFKTPMFQAIKRDQLKDPQLRDKETLDVVLKRVPAPGTKYRSLYDYIDDVAKQVPDADGFECWRVVSGIFAGNAAGKVSFQIGSKVDPKTKIFPSEEVKVLASNPNVDQTTKDLLAYFERCIAAGQTDINVGLITA